MTRCVNIDWLEVFCLEDIEVEHDATFFMKRGFIVKQREYGTPQYSQMFTIFVDGIEFLEIRRCPYSKKSEHGLFADNACHIRLSNRTCYEPHPIDLLRAFLLQYKYTLKGISRIDICLDFVKFDTGLEPQNLIKDYMAGELAKVNQCKLSAHGKDSFDDRVWNSLSWGAEKSMISTKLYNKTLEMKEVTKKPYIVQAWYLAGLITNMDDEDTIVWRLEFSIKSEAKKWVEVSNESTDTTHKQAMSNTLDCYDNRDKLFIIHQSLAQRYFHFKIVEFKNGKRLRKDRCKDKTMFRLAQGTKAYKPERLTDKHFPTRTDKILLHRCEEIANNETLEQWQRQAAKNMCIVLKRDIAEITYNNMMENLAERKRQKNDEQYLALEVDRQLQTDHTSKYFESKQ